MANKNITINDLAVMMKNSFDHVDKRFDKIENILIKKHDDEIADLRKRMGRLEEALLIK